MPKGKGLLDPTPVTFGTIAGRDVGALFDPVRKTALHEWHVAKGALFENVGQWKRPWYYPKPGEDMHAAVAREALAAREAVGMLDASTLGKIDVQGPDAAEFLNRVYSNAFLKLEVGRCRYGLMLKEDGMVFDDGVTARLGPNHFLMTTTTGGAANVLAWLERWFAGRYGDVRQIDVSTPSFMLLPHLVVATDRIATVQMRLARTYLQTLPIRLVEPAFELPKLTEILQWNVHRDPDPAIRWLRSVLKERATRFQSQS